MNCCKDKKPICRWSLLLLVAGWFLVALFLGETEILSILPGPVIPATVLSLALGLVSVYWFSAPFRRCLEEFDIRALIALHLTRFVGFYFLYLGSVGRLAREFALPAGWGDIVVSGGAVALLFVRGAVSRKWPVLLWNTVGLVDILLVVKIAASAIIANRNSMSVMTQLPLSFLPTMIVPLIIFTHVVIFARLRGVSDEASQGARMRPSNRSLESASVVSANSPAGFPQ